MEKLWEKWGDEKKHMVEYDIETIRQMKIAEYKEAGAFPENDV